MDLFLHIYKGTIVIQFPWINVRYMFPPWCYNRLVVIHKNWLTWCFNSIQGRVCHCYFCQLLPFCTRALFANWEPQKQPRSKWKECQKPCVPGIYFSVTLNCFFCNHGIFFLFWHLSIKMQLLCITWLNIFSWNNGQLSLEVSLSSYVFGNQLLET